MEAIKKAFHKLAHQTHPDKIGGDGARFKEVSEAYSWMKDHHAPAAGVVVRMYYSNGF